MGQQPTSSHVVTSGESTAAGAQLRPQESSFGHKVVDLVSGFNNDAGPQLPPQTRETVASLVDAATAQALAAAREMATGDASELRKLQRWLSAVVVVLAFAVFGVVLWSVNGRLEVVESARGATQDKLDKAAEHRARLDANVKTLAGHAVALTDAVNVAAQTNFDVLKSIADKLEAPIPASAKRPVTIEPPVTLRYIAGER